MVKRPNELISGFQSAVARCGIRVPPLSHESQLSPHKPHPLPADNCAVYVFSLSEKHGATCPAGSHRVLKVGKAGPNSNARFQSQHYNLNSSRSNLAASLADARFLWDYLGIHALNPPDPGQCVRDRTDRDNFYLPAPEKDLLDELERYIRGILGPVFEGG
jgi:hypothetical protein